MCSALLAWVPVNHRVRGIGSAVTMAVGVPSNIRSKWSATEDQKAGGSLTDQRCRSA